MASEIDLTNIRKNPMTYQDKTKEQLIEELNELQKKYNAAVEIHKEDIRNLNIIQNSIYVKDRAIETSFIGIVISDINGFTTYANDAFLKMWGYTKEELPKLHISDFGSDHEELLQLEKEIKEKGFVLGESIAKRKDGTTFQNQYTASLVTNSKGEPIATISSNLDVTERKQTKLLLQQKSDKIEAQNEEYQQINQKLIQINQELQKSKENVEESEKKYRLLYEYNPMPMSIFDEETLAFLSVNNAFIDKYGFTREEFLNMTILDIRPESEIERLKQTVGIPDQGLTNVGVYIHKKKNGELMHVEVIRHALDFNHKKAKLVLVNDVTDKIKANNDLILANAELTFAKEKAEESNQLKSAFISNMSHEIRTPLNGILGFSNFLSNFELSSEKKKQYIEVIQSSGHQLMTIIDDLIDISKIDANQMKIENNPVKINDVLQELFTLLNPSAISSKIDLDYSKDKNAEPIIVLTDVNRLRQVLINLITNAIKFTKQGHVKFGYAIKEEMIEFFIEDTGIGIAPEMHLAIFDRFTQLETGLSRIATGNGLGLSISSGLVKLLGGKIWLKSELGKGSTFYFTIPNNQVEKKSIEQPLIAKEVIKDSNQFTVLIAEDDNSNYFYLAELLTNMNIKFIHAENGKEAIEMVKQNLNIDLILMDLKMPVLNGYAATIEIKKIRPHLPIIAQTAYAQLTEKEKVIEAGCMDYVSKPIMENKLREIIEKYIVSDVSGLK